MSHTPDFFSFYHEKYLSLHVINVYKNHHDSFEEIST